MNKGAETTVKALRAQLVSAREERDLGKLRDVEDGLRQLGQVGYRCCLVDFDRCRLRYYVRLLGYDQARVKAQIEFPIVMDVDPVQWVPLSHLADYDEAKTTSSIHRIYEGMARYIQQKSPQLQVGSGRLGLPASRRERVAVPDGKCPRRWARLVFGGAVAVLAIAGLVSLRLANGTF